MATLSKQEYLKRYISGDTQDSKKRRKKIKHSVIPISKIIDDDVDFETLLPDNLGNTLEEDVGDNEPTVADFVDERPEHIQRMEEYRASGKWKTLNDKKCESAHQFGVIDDDDDNSANHRHDSDSDLSPVTRTNVISQRKRHDSDSDQSPSRTKRHDSDSDQSPTRTKRHDSGSDQSPPRRKRHDSDSDQSPTRTKRHDSGSDQSPPRRKRHNTDSDQSPPRRKKHNTNSDQLQVRNKRHDSDSDQSPPRRKIHSDSDQSPPRRKRHNSDSDQSPPRRKTRVDSDQSPPRRKRHNSDSDQSPPRRKTRVDSDLSPPRRNKGGYGRTYNNDSSSPRRHAHRSNTDSRDRRKAESDNKKASKTLSGAKAGLSSARDMKLEAEIIRKRENEAFHKIGIDKLGKHATTVFRDKSGRRRNLEEEKNKEKEENKKKAEEEKQYNEWGKGLKQKEDREKMLQENLHEISKPLARYRDDEDLDNLLKEKERDGDPMAAFMKKKKNKNANNNMNAKPKYRGPQPPPNRYGIMPGYRWDGVDRSNGFESKLFAKASEKRAVDLMAYKWSTEDM